MFVNGIWIGLGVAVAWFIVIPLIAFILSLIPLAFLGLVALLNRESSSAPSTAKMSRRDLKRRQALGYDTHLPLPPPWWKRIFFKLNLMSTLKDMFASARDEVAYRRSLGYDTPEQKKSDSP